MPYRHNSLNSDGNRCVCTSITCLEFTTISTRARSSSGCVSRSANFVRLSVDVTISFLVFYPQITQIVLLNRCNLWMKMDRPNDRSGSSESNPAAMDPDGTDTITEAGTTHDTRQLYRDSA